MKRTIKHMLFALVATLVLYSCSPAENQHPGNEYMPDMGHSIAQESNVYDYYYYNTWDSASTVKLKELSIPGLPVANTVPRGYAGIKYAIDQGKTRTEVMEELRGEGSVAGIAVPVNGHVPYYYSDTEADRQRAIAELVDNPFPITQDGLQRGQMLYMTFCGICHGTAGNGLGYLVSEENPNAVYPAAPANFLLDEHVNASNGRYYHAIMYGKNVMGGYADKISYEERWQVIHWIRALQAKDKKLEYTAEANTFNPAYGTPMAQMSQLSQQMEEAVPAEGEAAPPDGQEHAPGDGHEHEGDHDYSGDSQGKK